MLSEEAGRIVLREVFEAAGFAIVEDYLLDGVRIDGYDPEAGVGYEYLTRADPKSIEALHNRHIFLLDEKRVPDANTLIEAVFEFLGEVQREN